MKKRGFYNVLFSLISQIVTFAAGIILPRLFIANLGSEANGLISSIGQIYAYVGLIEAGLGSTVIQALYKPISADDKYGTNRILAAARSSYRRIGVIYIACIVAVAVLYPILVKTSLPTWQVVAVALFSGLGGAVNFLLQQHYIVLLAAEGKSYISTNLGLGVHLLSSILKAVLILKGYNVAIIVAGQFAVTLLRILFLNIYMRRHYNWLDFTVEPDTSALSKQKYVFIQQISYFIYSNTDVTVLTFFTNLRVVSVYSVYVMIVGTIEGLIFSFSSGLVFAMGQLYQQNKERFKKLYEVYDKGYMLLVFALFTVVYICIIPFMRLYTAGVTDINYIDPTLAFLFVILKMVTALRSQSNNAINFAGFFEETKTTAILEAALNVVISLVAVQFWGIHGVIVGSIVSALYRGVAVTNFTNKHILEYTGFQSIKKYVYWGVNLVTFLLISFSIQWFVPDISNYIELVALAAVVTVICFAVYGCIWVIMERESFRYGWEMLTKTVKDKLNKS